MPGRSPNIGASGAGCRCGNLPKPKPPTRVAATVVVTMAELFADAEHAKLMASISDAHQAGEQIPCMESTRPLDWISDRPADQHRAAAGCAVCPLALQCRDYATTFREPSGTWGGTTPKERGGNRGLPRLKNVEKRTK